MAFNPVDSPSPVTMNSEQWPQIRREELLEKKKKKNLSIRIN